jgi:hypothetical protein
MTMKHEINEILLKDLLNNPGAFFHRLIIAKKSSDDSPRHSGKIVIGGELIACL